MSWYGLFSGWVGERAWLVGGQQGGTGGGAGYRVVWLASGWVRGRSEGSRGGGGERRRGGQSGALGKLY